MAQDDGMDVSPSWQELKDERDALASELRSHKAALNGLQTERDALRETARLAERFARAKGRHHSQHAACDLMEHFGLPCVRPGGES